MFTHPPEIIKIIHKIHKRQIGLEYLEKDMKHGRAKEYPLLENAFRKYI